MRFQIILLSCVFATAAAFCDLPTSIGGAGESVWEKYQGPAAWFAYPDRTVHYCMEVNPEFGAFQQKAEESIQYAIRTWVEYIQKKRIVQYTTRKPYLATRFEYRKQCAGNEDLTFYLGIQNTLVEKYRALHRKPTAFSAAYDLSKTGWSRGFIWVAAQGSIDPTLNYPSWKNPGDLPMIFLHEMGHVFGNDHYTGTIMDPNVATQIGRTKNPTPQIDQKRELVICIECGDTRVGTVDTPGGLSVFSLLTGRKAQGKLALSLTREKDASGWWQEMKFKDDLGETVFALPASKFLVTPLSNALTPIFFFAKGIEGKTVNEAGMDSFAGQHSHEALFEISVAGKTGKKVYFSITDNSSRSYLGVRAIYEGESVSLCSVPPPEGWIY